jgi:ABC-type multidrug transport system permease subunit
MFIQLVLMELKSFYRNPGIIFWAFGFPLLMAGVLGSAFSNKKESIRKIGIVGENSIQLVSQYKSISVPENSYSQYEFTSITEEEAIKKMKRGELQLYLESSNNDLIYYFDPSNSESYQSYLLLEKLLNKSNISSGKIVSINTKGSRYVDFLIPGLLALGIMNSCIWGSGWTLIEFRIKKLMRRMMATPLPKWIFLMSHVFTRFILSGLEFIFLIIFSYLMYDVQIQGSYLAMILCFFSGNFAFSGVAILFSSRASNTQVANGLINLITFPMTICSGVFFSYHNFPEQAEKFIRYFPLTLIADSIRSIYNEGAQLTDVILPVIILNIIGAIFFTIGLKVYKWD